MDQSNINIKEGGETEERKKKGETNRQKTLMTLFDILNPTIP